MWTLFQVASLEGWATVMHNAQAAVGPEQQPVPGTNKAVALLFVATIVICSYFMLNMIIGVSIDKASIASPEFCTPFCLSFRYTRGHTCVHRRPVTCLRSSTR